MILSRPPNRHSRAVADEMRALGFPRRRRPGVGALLATLAALGTASALASLSAL